MGKVNWGRVLAGGLVAGVVVWLMEGAASLLYMDEMEAALAAHDLTFEMSGGVAALTVLVSLVIGLGVVWLYAAIRPRFGAGPRTAVIAAVFVWAVGYVTAIIGWSMLGIYNHHILVLWVVIGLIELLIATLIGAWIYREVEVP